MWWWWPTSGGTPLLSYHPRARIETVNDKETNLLLDDIPSHVRDEFGERGALLLLQLYGGASVILINENREALAMDILWGIERRSKDDSTSIEQMFGGKSNTELYPFKCKVMPLTLLIDMYCEARPRLIDAVPP